MTKYNLGDFVVTKKKIDIGRKGTLPEGSLGEIVFMLSPWADDPWYRVKFQVAGTSTIHQASVQESGIARHIETARIINSRWFAISNPIDQHIANPLLRSSK